MIYQIQKPQFPISHLQIQLPGSKSETNRLLIIQHFLKQSLDFKNASESDDSFILEKALKFDSTTIHVGKAGTAMRFLTALLAITPGEWIIEGDERMHERPIEGLVDCLRELGAEIEYTENEGYPPLKIKGKPLDGGVVQLENPLSSQFVSALMLVAPYMKNGLTIELFGDIVSQPYITMTSGLLWDFGVEVQFSGKKIIIPPCHYEFKPHNVESDWSAAGYWYALNSFLSFPELELSTLRLVSFQGDKKIVELYKNFGIETRFGKDKVVLCNFHQVSNYFKHDFKDEPDQVQTFVCLAAAHRIKARFSGLQTLFIKETNRVDALQKELKKFNVEMNETTPGFYELQYGDVPDKTIPIRISTYEDHRMAMAFSVWAAAGYCIEIENPEVVSKSYPHYWDDLRRAGFSVEEVNE